MSNHSRDGKPFVGRLEAFNRLVPTTIDPILARTIGYYLSYPKATHLFYDHVEDHGCVVKPPHSGCSSIEFFYSNGKRGYCGGSRRSVTDYYCDDCKGAIPMDYKLRCIRRRYIGYDSDELCGNWSVQGLPFCPLCCLSLGIPLFKENTESRTVIEVEGRMVVKIESKLVVKPLGSLRPVKPKVQAVALPAGCCILRAKGCMSKYCNKPTDPLSPFCKKCLGKFILSSRRCIMLSHVRDGIEVACDALCWVGHIFCPSCCIKNGSRIEKDNITQEGQKAFRNMWGL